MSMRYLVSMKMILPQYYTLQAKDDGENDKDG